MRNLCAALRVARMTNLQTGQPLNIKETRMKTLFASTAIVIAMAAPAFADAHMASAFCMSPKLTSKWMPACPTNGMTLAKFLTS